MNKGLNELLKDQKEQNLEEWTAMFKEKVRDIFKDAQEATWLQYCPHSREMIQLSTNPKKNFCDKCIHERLNKADESKT